MIVFRVIALVIFIAVGQDVASIMQSACPLATLGKPYQLHCRGEINTINRFILWDKIDQQNKKSDIVRCYYDSPCNIIKPYKYNAKNSRSSDGHFESTLTILNVSELDIGQTISCSAMVVSINIQPVEFMVCTLSAFYVVQPPLCSASHVLPNSVQLLCHFPKVHPKVTCQLGYGNRIFENKTSLVEYEVKSVTENSVVYYDITCKGILKIYDKQSKDYLVKVLPQSETGNVNEEVEGQVMIQKVILEPTKAQVIINRQRYVSLCTSNITFTSVNVTCTVWTSDSDPSVIFQVDSSQVKSTSSKTEMSQIDGLYGTVHEYQLIVSRMIKEKRLECHVNDQLHDSAILSVALPPKALKFRTAKNKPIPTTIFISVNETLSAVCSVEGGYPKVSSVSVICTFFNGTVALRVTDFTDVVSFNISWVKNSSWIDCECSAQHVSGCDIKTAKLQLLDSSLNETRGNEDRNIYTPLYYVGGAFVCLIIVLITIAAIAYFCHHRRTPKPPPGEYTYIDEVDRRGSSQSEQLMRLRDHIEVHQLEDKGRFSTNGHHLHYENSSDPAAPPCGRTGSFQWGVSASPRTSNESSPPCEKISTAPPLPRRMSSRSDDEDAQYHLTHSKTSYDRQIPNDYTPFRKFAPQIRTPWYDADYISPGSVSSSPDDNLNHGLKGEEKRWRDEEERRNEEAYLIELLKSDAGILPDEEI